MFNKIKELFGSRKFLAAMVTAALVYINSQLNLLNEVQMAQIVGVVSAWIIGQGIVDAKN